MKPGLKTLIAGILLFILGAIIFPLLLLIPLFSNESTDKQFLIPGEKEITVSKSGRYHLWNDYQTIYEGKSYDKSECVPDGLVILVRNEDGESLSFKGNTSMTSSNGSSAKGSIGYVDVSEPCKLTVSVTGDTEERVFSFSKSIFKKIITIIFGGGSLLMLVSIAGVGITIWGIVKLARSKPDEHRS